MIFTPRRLASEITLLSAVASAGLMMIAFAPEEIRLRIAAICSGAAPFWLDTSTLSTAPLASACALTAQIISSRQPLPTRVLDTPSVNFLFALPPPPELELDDPESSLPQAATVAARANASSVAPTRLLLGRPIFLLLGVWNDTAQRARKAPRMLGVCVVEELGRAAFAHDGGTGDDRGQRAALLERDRRPYLQLVGQRDCRDGRARADRLLDALQPDQRVAGRGAEVEDDVGVIEQGRRRLRRGHRDHGESAPAGARRHL